jgi:hypothetical protein
MILFPDFIALKKYLPIIVVKNFHIIFHLRKVSLKNEELLCRISQEIQTEYIVNICPAVFNMGKNIIRAFRVKDIDPEKLIDIINFLKNKELTFFKNEPVKSFLSRIRLKAFFDIREINKGIYINTTSMGLYYLEISEYLEWDVFERMITYQKLNSRFKILMQP